MKPHTSRLQSAPLSNRTFPAKNPPSLLLLQAILLAGSKVCTNPQLMGSSGSTTPAAVAFYKPVSNPSVSLSSLARLGTLLLGVNHIRTILSAAQHNIGRGALCQWIQSIPSFSYEILFILSDGMTRLPWVPSRKNPMASHGSQGNAVGFSVSIGLPQVLSSGIQSSCRSRNASEMPCCP
jgi:hypothetical protein